MSVRTPGHPGIHRPRPKGACVDVVRSWHRTGSPLSWGLAIVPGVLPSSDDADANRRRRRVQERKLPRVVPQPPVASPPAGEPRAPAVRRPRTAAPSTPRRSSPRPAAPRQPRRPTAPWDSDPPVRPANSAPPDSARPGTQWRNPFAVSPTVRRPVDPGADDHPFAPAPTWRAPSGFPFDRQPAAAVPQPGWRPGDGKAPGQAAPAPGGSPGTVDWNRYWYDYWRRYFRAHGSMGHPQPSCSACHENPHPRGATPRPPAMADARRSRSL